MSAPEEPVESAKNPYQASAESGPVQAKHALTLPDLTADSNFTRYVQLAVRWAGLTAALEGLGMTLGSAAYLVMFGIAQQRAGYDWELDPYGCCWFVNGMVLLVGGFYLMVDGGWFLRNVFMPASTPDPEDEEPSK